MEKSSKVSILICLLVGAKTLFKLLEIVLTLFCGRPKDI